MRQKLNVITLGVSDLAALLKFYRDGLGWKTAGDSSDSIAFFDMGGIVLALYPRKMLADDVSIPEQGSGFSGITLAYNAKSEEEVNQVFVQVEKVGASIVKPPHKVFWGGYSGYFADPDKHLWEVAYNPYWSFDERDHVVIE